MGAVLGVIPPALKPIMVVAGPLVGAVAAAATGIAAAFGAFRPPSGQNPTFANIQAIQEAEEARKRAEEAYNIAEEARRKAEQDLEDARMRQEEADEAAALAVKETERMRAQMEDEVNAAKKAQELSNIAANAAQEEIARLTLEAQKEREHSQRMCEEAEKVTAGIREDVKKAQKAADEQLRQAEVDRRRAEESARAAHDEMQKATEAREEAERRLKDGIQPVVVPTPEEFAAAKERMGYRDDLFHFAVAGVSGSGKSTLVNAFRGLRSMDPDAAAVGVTETTLHMTRYPDTNKPFVWYDIPGAGTLKCPDWQYFNDQGLYVFDCIIVVLDNRFTMTDVAILTNARRFKIPTFIVRSKADQHIANIMKEMGYDSEEEGTEAVRRQLYKLALDQFVERTKNTVKTNLEDADLPEQRVYIVSSSVIRGIVQNRMPEKRIDEVALISDALSQVYRRR